ncbi:MAG: hypothetical protein PHF97_01080 [Bacteroidales bacterium]|nr:hypothetical protein [Bacteroidales bacterium]
MMEKDDLFNRDWVANMIKNRPMEQPSEDFIDRVMEKVRLSPEPVPASKPYYHYIKSMVVYFIIAALVVFVFITSDFPFLNWIPGKTSFTQYFLPYMTTTFTGLKNAFSSRYISFGLLIGASAMLLYLVDLLFSRHSSMKTHPLA